MLKGIMKNASKDLLIPCFSRCLNKCLKRPFRAFRLFLKAFINALYNESCCSTRHCDQRTIPSNCWLHRHEPQPVRLSRAIRHSTIKLIHGIRLRSKDDSGDAAGIRGAVRRPASNSCSYKNLILESRKFVFIYRGSLSCLQPAAHELIKPFQWQKITYQSSCRLVDGRGYVGLLRRFVRLEAKLPFLVLELHILILR